MRSNPLLLSLPLSLIPAAALAQAPAVAPPAKPVAAAVAKAPAAAARQQALDEEDAQQEIVVRAARPAGSVIGDIPPEVTLTPADIRSYGVNNISDLLDQITPQTGNGRGGQPVILLSGRRISSFAEIRDLPTEAILRTEVLPQEVSLKYGYSADQRVVNIVLRPRFRALIGQGGASIATEGGGESVNPEFNLIRINKDKRISVNLRYQDSAALKESQRNIISAGTTGGTTSTDLSEFRTLRGSSEQYSSNIVYAMPAFARSSASLNGSLSYTRGDALNGLPLVGLAYVGTDPLHQRTENLTGHLGLSLNGDRGSWRWSVTGNYDRIDTKTRTETGIAANPLNRAHSVANSEEINALVGGPLARLPAGALSTTLRAGLNIDGFDSTSMRAGVTTASNLTRRNANGQINFDLPIASSNFLPFLGQLSANANANVRQLSDFGTLRTIGYGLVWTPIKPINLIASMTQNEGAPSVQQLGNPLIVTPQVRVFDSARGTTVDVTQIAGGNRGLLANDNHVLRLGATIKPLAKSDLTLIANFTRTRTKNAIANLPEPTPDIEAAFPERFVRDASGRLVSVDVRPVNFQRESEDALRLGFNFSIPLKSIIQRKFEQYIADRRAGKNPPFPIQLTEAQRKRLEQLQQRQNGGRAGQAGGEAGAQAGQGQNPGAVIFGGQGGGGPPPGAFAFGGPGGPPGGPGGGPGGAGGGAGGGGFRGGFGGGGGGFGGGAQGRLQIALYDQWTLKDTVLIRPGVPLIDLRNGGSVASGGGTPEHKLELQLGYSNNGLGVRLSGNWQSGTTVRAGPTSTTGDLTFKPLTTATVRLFADVGQMPMFIGKEWARGLRVNFTINNIANSRQQVRDQNGATPVRYQPAYLDALGRTVGITVRKLWL